MSNRPQDADSDGGPKERKENRERKKGMTNDEGGGESENQGKSSVPVPGLSGTCCLFG